jgi:hypothetical protein
MSDIDYHEAVTNVMGGSLETSENRENDGRTERPTGTTFRSSRTFQGNIQALNRAR